MAEIPVACSQQGQAPITVRVCDWNRIQRRLARAREQRDIWRRRAEEAEKREREAMYQHIRTFLRGQVEQERFLRGQVEIQNRALKDKLAELTLKESARE